MGSEGIFRGPTSTNTVVLEPRRARTGLNKKFTHLTVVRVTRVDPRRSCTAGGLALQLPPRVLRGQQ